MSSEIQSGRRQFPQQSLHFDLFYQNRLEEWGVLLSSIKRWKTCQQLWWKPVINKRRERTESKKKWFVTVGEALRERRKYPNKSPVLTEAWCKPELLPLWNCVHIVQEPLQSLMKDSHILSEIKRAIFLSPENKEQLLHPMWKMQRATCSTYLWSLWR